MHLDPVGSEEPSTSDLSDFAADELIDQAAPTAREGLPKRFRMRHGRHYVDELLGDAPLRTVREIPIAEIEPGIPEMPDTPVGHADGFDPERLEESIRDVGIIEPLLVARRGAQYHVIAGMRRLRAAQTVGLNTVPCLVQDVDDQKLGEMRRAVAQRFTVTPPAEPPPSTPAVSDAPGVLTALMLRTNDLADERLAQSVLADLSGVELLRAKTASAAADILTRSAAIERAPVSWAALIQEVVSAVAVEARLRGVRIDVTGLQADSRISLDSSWCRHALTGLAHCMLALSPRAGTVLDIRAQVTTVRPALIIECQLRAGAAGDDLPAVPWLSPLMNDEALARFFDADWREHPCGASGGRMLAALARTARAHGGRAQVQSSGAVTFVVPRPLIEV